jgi:hypothetical protein
MAAPPKDRSWLEPVLVFIVAIVIGVSLQFLLVRFFAIGVARDFGLGVTVGLVVGWSRHGLGTKRALVWLLVWAIAGAAVTVGFGELLRDAGIQFPHWDGVPAA